MEDGNATFIIEVVNTQKRVESMKKIQNYFNDCHIKSVLACNIGNDENQGGAYIKFWKPPKESEPKDLLKRNPE